MEATFIRRPNRFLGEVELNGERYEAHVHDPGRLRGLLYPNNRMLVAKPRVKKQRKTGLDLLFAWDGRHWILVNSALHRSVSEKILVDPGLSPCGAVQELVPEIPYGKGTRFDFYLRSRNGRGCYIEVKGCTFMDANRVALFPDAPTERGVRHLEELMDVLGQGFHAVLLILVFRPDARSFSPNEQCDPGFSRVFHEGVRRGIKVYAKRIDFKKGWFVYTGDIPVDGSGM